MFGKIFNWFFKSLLETIAQLAVFLITINVLITCGFILTGMLKITAGGYLIGIQLVATLLFFTFCVFILCFVVNLYSNFKVYGKQD